MRHFLLLVSFFVTITSQAESAFPIPEGYVLQELDPTAGKIAKPKDWYYTSQGTTSGWMWVISAEDSSKGRYETGLRIQMIVGIEEKTKQKGADFAKNFLARKKSSVKVIRECPESEQETFKRQCLEVMEKIGETQYRIIYSALWGKSLDMVVITTFGTPEEKWESMRPIADTMSYIELIGADFGKKR